MLALWRTWWVGHRSKTHGGFKPGRLENVLVLFIRNREEINRRRRYGFGGKKSNSVSVLNWNRVGIPWQCRVDDHGGPQHVLLPSLDPLPVRQRVSSPRLPGCAYPVIISEVVQKEGPIIYGKEIKGTNLSNIRALCF